MATNYTSLLGFALPTTGELAGTWGQVVNDSITQLVEDSVAGTATVSVTAGNVVLTTTGSGAANQARCAIIIATGTPGVARSITAPSQSKAYIFINQSDSNVTFKGAATTGHTVKPGEAHVLVWNGSDFINVEQGDVAGPGSSTDNAIARFDGTTGRIIQNSVVTIADGSGDIQTSGKISVGDGTASLPSITNVGDTNTGIYFSADNEVSISTDGTQRVVVDATGDVGIGTASPAVKLDVSGQISSSGGIAFSGALASGTGVASSGANGDLRFYSNGTQYVTLNTSGNVGIGTSSQTQRLEVYNSATNSQCYVVVQNNRSRNVGVLTKTTNGGFYTGTSIGTDTLCWQVYDETNGERLKVTSAGFTQPLAYADTVVAIGNTGTAATITLTSGNVFTATLTGNCTFTLSSPIATGSSSFTLILTNDGTAGRTVAWSGGSFNFPGGAASLSRTTTANATDIWAFFTPNGGTTWYGNIVMKDVKA